MNRRQFIAKTAKAAAITSVAGDLTLIGSGCQSTGFRRASKLKPNFEVAAEGQLPKIALARNEDHVRALNAALDAIGGIKRFIKKGDKVLLKPNAAWDRVPEQGVNTNPDVIGEMVRQCMLAGASKVTVTDYGASDPHRAFRRSGIREAVEKNGGRMVITQNLDFLIDDLDGKLIGEWPVLKYVFEADRLINMPIAKHHDLALGSASMKNFFGAIGGIRDGLHDNLDQAIVDLASYFRPTLTVVDATRVLLRRGPSGGSFDDVGRFDSVICSIDQVAADSRACEFLGKSGEHISHIVLASKQGLGEMDYQKAGYKEIV